MKCIICQTEHKKQTVEHIVPRALGNIHYILRKGVVCGNCNNRFAKYEHVVLNCDEWLQKRKDQGLIRNVAIEPGRDPSSSELALFMLKILYEALYSSRRNIFNVLHIEYVRQALIDGQISHFQIYKGRRILRAKPIPQWLDRWRLSMNQIGLAYRLHDVQLWFEFRFTDIYTVIVLNVMDQEMAFESS